MSDKGREKYKLLVTGGSGFIGTYLIDVYEARGARILNLDIAPPLKSEQAKYWKKLDLLDGSSTSAAFQEFEPTHVLHLAARTDLDEEKDINGYAVNIEGVENVMNAIKDTDSVQRVIVASTMYVCETGYQPKSDEDFNPHTLYGQSKVLTEKITRNAALDCAWSIIRPAVIWGPYHERLRRGFFAVMRRGLYFHPGHTEARKSYGYIGNSVYQIDRIFESDRRDIDRKVFYIADRPVNLMEWVDGFSREMLGRKVRRMPLPLMKLLANIGDTAVKLGYPNFPMTSFRLGNMINDNIVDTVGINKVAGQLPYSMDEGIRETVAWLKRE